MKLNLLLITLALVGFSSCAKVNYGGRPLGVGGLSNQDNKPLGTPAFQMTEGDKGTQFRLELTNNFSADTNYVWTIVSLDANVNPLDRFETPTGTTVGVRGQKVLPIIVSAVDIDTLRQGTQQFKIELRPVNGAGGMIEAGLTLLDAQLQSGGNLPILSFEDYEVESDANLEAHVALKLDRPSTVPVTVDVKLKDGTALLHIHYSGYKGVGSEKIRSVVFAPGQTRVELPVIGIRRNNECNTQFYPKMIQGSVRGATISRDRATVTIPCINEPPPPPPPPAPLEARYVDDTVTAAEGTNAYLEVELNTNETHAPVTLKIRTVEGSAKEGEHYQALHPNFEKVIAGDQSDVRFYVVILPQTECKPTTSFTVEVTEIEGAVMRQRIATVTIPRNEELCAPPPVVPVNPN